MAEKSTDKSSVTINSVSRTLDILEYLYTAGQGVAVSQISKDLDLYKSTVFRSLATLQSRGYVIQDPKSELYMLGPKIFAFSPSRYGSSGLPELIHPYLDKLNARFWDAVNLGQLSRSSDGMYHIMIVGECASRLSLGAKIEVGSMSECYCASLGKCLLAFSDNIDLSVYENAKMEKFTENTITTVDGLRRELEKVREQGYAIDNEEREKGLYCIGVPILRDGAAVAAFSLSGPVTRTRDDHREEKIEYMKELSRQITKDLFIN